MVDSEADSQAGVIAFLSDGAAFAGKAVETAETHTAMVFLAGDRAYKLKKSIKYSYLDYSTVALRRASCEAEVAINRRFAPDLYLGVEAIVERGAGQYGLGGEGPAVDWVVVMRRFDQDAQLDRMAMKGHLPLELMRPLADRIVDVHNAAERSTTHGGGQGLRQAIDITIQNLRLATAHGLSPDAVNRWSARVLEQLADDAVLLDERRSTGHVRACHGDLHLQNICLIEGRPTLFDAIEFDPSLSTTDVLYDLAFLLMDLEHRGLGGHGNRVFNRYLDRADEAGGVKAFRLFMSVRAAIRAQIAIAAAQHRHDSQGTASYVDQAQSYLALALCLLAPSPPRLVAIGGASGTGKSTQAQAIAPKLWEPPGARILRSDVLRKRIADVDPETALPAVFYTPEWSDKVYTALLGEARRYLESGCSVVLDAVFAKQNERDAAKNLAQTLDVPFRGVWLNAPLPELQQRIVARRHDASDATVDVAQKQLSWIEAPADWSAIDAAGTVSAITAAVLKVL